MKMMSVSFGKRLEEKQNRFYIIIAEETNLFLLRRMIESIRIRDSINKTELSNYKANCSKMLRYTILLSLILYLQTDYVSAFSSAVTDKRFSTKSIENLEESDANNSLSSRRSVLLTTFSAAAVAAFSPGVANAAPPGPKSNIDPETAYLNLRKAREELVFAGRTYFPKQNWEGLREYLNNEDACINNYDANASALLTSKRLDAESKQAIGTIRRYGVGADVIIMYGGLKAELADDAENFNSSEISKYYIKTLDSLEEVIAIVRSNPGFSKLN